MDNLRVKTEIVVFQMLFRLFLKKFLQFFFHQIFFPFWKFFLLSVPCRIDFGALTGHLKTPKERLLYLYSPNEERVGESSSLKKEKKWTETRREALKRYFFAWFLVENGFFGWKTLLFRVLRYWDCWNGNFWAGKLVRS